MTSPFFIFSSFYCCPFLDYDLSVVHSFSFSLFTRLLLALFSLSGVDPLTTHHCTCLHLLLQRLVSVRFANGSSVLLFFLFLFQITFGVY